MTIQMICRKNVPFAKRGKPIIRIAKTGHAMISLEACNALQLKEGDEVVFFFDEKEKKTIGYIAKSPAKELGFLLRQNKKLTYGLYFQNAGMVKFIIDKLDLAVGEGKKPSVRLDIDVENPIHHKDFKLFKIY